MEYIEIKEKEPLILVPEDWTEDEWATILKLFGLKYGVRVVISDYTLKAFGIVKPRGEVKDETP